VLREEQIAIDGDVEDAPVATNQVDGDADLPLDFGRQTGGPGKIVSTPAVGDRDLHRRGL